MVRGTPVPDCEDLSPEACAILDRMVRIAHVLDQHRAAVARLSRELAVLQAEFERIEDGK